MALYPVKDGKDAEDDKNSKCELSYFMIKVYNQTNNFLY